MIGANGNELELAGNACQNIKITKQKCQRVICEKHLILLRMNHSELKCEVTERCKTLSHIPNI